MKLIIAEKPSLARNIVAGIGEMKKMRGFFINSEYIVSWAFGHLFSLCDIEHYSGKTQSGKWSMENIPCFPEKFDFELKKGSDGKFDQGVKDQFQVLKELCLRDDIDTIVNAGDADREGEIIIRLIIMNTGVSGKKLARLWLPDQTPETVRAALAELKEEKEYDNLAGEGFARTYIDWLYGVNLTRFATLKTGTLLRVGRVIVPIVKAIYDRDNEIKNFIPEKYYSIVSDAETNGIVCDITSKKKFSENELAKAEEYAKLLSEVPCKVISKKEKKDALNPGKLYSLTKLQNHLAKKYKMPMEDSLKFLQSLYEKGYVTYPRTNSEYLANAEKDKTKNIISLIEKLGYPVKFRDDKKIFDDSKIESHSALTPTTKIPAKNALSEDEYKVYKAVFCRFVAVFCAEKCICGKSELELACGDIESFILKGAVIIEKGWTKYDDYTKNDKILPSLKIGDTVNTNFHPKESMTSPPKHYTVETLNNYLKNPFRKEMQKSEENDEFDDAADYKAIFEGLELGTEATRTGIIDNAIKSGYIDRKKDVYTILPDGSYLIESLIGMGISMDKYKTSNLGRALKKVFKGEMLVDDAVLEAKNEISDIFAKSASADDTGLFRDQVGICPLCGNEVRKGKYYYGCLGYKDGCKFRIPINLCRRAIPIIQAKKLISDGKTDKIEKFISKNGKEFSAALKLENGEVKFDF